MKKTLKSVDLTLIMQSILSILVMLIGVVTTIFKSFGLVDIVLYSSILFFVYAFFSIICYFTKRREGDYEILLLSLINILTGTFMFVFKKDEVTMILGLGMTIYSIMVVMNRVYKIFTLKSVDNFMWIIKLFGTVLIGLLGMLTSYNLFNEVSVQTLLYGYYFVSLGFIMLLENLIEIFITEDRFNKILKKLIYEEEPKLEEVKSTKKVTSKVKKVSTKKDTKSKSNTKKDSKTSTKKKTTVKKTK